MDSRKWAARAGLLLLATVIGVCVFETAYPSVGPAVQLQGAAQEQSPDLWGPDRFNQGSGRPSERFLAEADFYGFYGFYGITEPLMECDVVVVKFSLFNYSVEDLRKVNVIQYIIYQTMQAVDLTYLEANPTGSTTDYVSTVTELDGSLVTYVVATVEVNFAAGSLSPSAAADAGGIFAAYIGMEPAGGTAPVRRSVLEGNLDIFQSDSVDTEKTLAVDIVVAGYQTADLEDDNELAAFSATINSAFKSSILSATSSTEAADTVVVTVTGLVDADSTSVAARVSLAFKCCAAASASYETDLGNEDPYFLTETFGVLTGKIKVSTTVATSATSYEVTMRRSLLEETNPFSKNLAQSGLGLNSVDPALMECRLEELSSFYGVYGVSDSEDAIVLSDKTVIASDGTLIGSQGTDLGSADEILSGITVLKTSVLFTAVMPDTPNPLLIGVDETEAFTSEYFDYLTASFDSLEITSAPEVSILSITGDTVSVKTEAEFSNDAEGAEALFLDLTEGSTTLGFFPPGTSFIDVSMTSETEFIDTDTSAGGRTSDSEHSGPDVTSEFYGIFSFYGGDIAQSELSSDTTFKFEVTSSDGKDTIIAIDSAGNNVGQFSDAAVLRSDGTVVGSDGMVIGSQATELGSTSVETDAYIATSFYGMYGVATSFYGLYGAEPDGFYGYHMPVVEPEEKAASTGRDPSDGGIISLPPPTPSQEIPVYFTTILSDFNMDDLFNEEDMALFRADYITAVEAAIKLLGITSNPTVTIQGVHPASVAVPTLVTFIDDEYGAQLFMEVLSSNPSLAFPAFSGLGAITIVEVSSDPNFNAGAKDPVEQAPVSPGTPLDTSDLPCPISRVGESCCGPAMLDAQNDCCWKGVDECGICGGNSDTCATTATVRLLVNRPGMTTDTDTSEFAAMEEDFTAGMANLFSAFNINAENIVIDTAGVTAQRTAAGLEFDIPFRINPDLEANIAAPTLTKARAILVAAAEQKTESDGMTIVAVLDVARAGVCGNNHCEIGEFFGSATHNVASECPADCPAYIGCPSSAGKTCSGNGDCATASGECKCKTGYAGDDCSVCAAGFLSANGLCVLEAGTRSTNGGDKSNATDIILGVVFGVVALVLIGLLCYYVFVIRKRNEASREEGLAFSSQQQVPASNEEPDIPTRQLTENTV